jgi:16S rRNA (uracil1498-N3)-methyltransferase
MKHRLYLQEVLADGRRLSLGVAESHYLLRVLRHKKGAELVCFNGQGAQWRATISAITGKQCEICVHEQLCVARQPIALHLAQAWLKSSAMDTVVQKATELGISDLWPLSTARSNVRLPTSRLEKKLHHWRKISRSACEQSGRLFLPAVHEPISLQALLSAPPTATCLFLDPGEEPLVVAPEPEPLTICIGPEGGWTDEERTVAADLGARICGIGNLTLRAETAPVAVLAAIRHSWGWRE